MSVNRVIRDRSEPLRLLCDLCDRTTVLDAAQQEEILASLTLPAQRAIIECPCGHGLFALGARPIRAVEVTT